MNHIADKLNGKQHLILYLSSKVSKEWVMEVDD